METSELRKDITEKVKAIAAEKKFPPELTMLLLDRVQSASESAIQFIAQMKDKCDGNCADCHADHNNTPPAVPEKVEPVTVGRDPEKVLYDMINSSDDVDDSDDVFMHDLQEANNQKLALIKKLEPTLKQYDNNIVEVMQDNALLSYLAISTPDDRLDENGFLFSTIGSLGSATFGPLVQYFNPEIDDSKLIRKLSKKINKKVSKLIAELLEENEDLIVEHCSDLIEDFEVTEARKRINEIPNAINGIIMANIYAMTNLKFNKHFDNGLSNS